MFLFFKELERYTFFIKSVTFFSDLLHLLHLLHLNLTPLLFLHTKSSKKELTGAPGCKLGHDRYLLVESVFIFYLLQ